MVYFTSLQEPFGAKGSKARQAFTKECYDRPRTLQGAEGAGEEAMYLNKEVCSDNLTVIVTVTVL